MYNKIKEYVNYQLRFDSSENNQEKKEEIIANISDRYDEIFNKTGDANLAYMEAVKTMGDFSSGNVEKAYQPKVSEMFLIAGLILAVFGLLITFFSAVTGAIVVMLSFISFSIGSYSLYQESQYIKKEEYDINKHNYYLKNIFSYMKTCFTFWSISLSLLLTLLFYNLIGTILVLGSVETIFSMNDILSLFLLLFIIFLILFLIILSIFKSLYKRLIRKYYLITGENKLISIGQRIKQFLNMDYINETIFQKTWFYPTLIMLFSLACFVILILQNAYEYNIEFSNMIEFAGVITTIIIAYIAYSGKFKNRFVSPLVFLISSVVYSGLSIYRTRSVGPFSLLCSLVLLIIIIIDGLVSMNHHKLNKR